LKPFPHQLRTIRKECGYTQAELGRLARLTATDISRFECGFREPDLEQLIDIVRALSCDANRLLGFCK